MRRAIIELIAVMHVLTNIALGDSIVITNFSSNSDVAWLRSISNDSYHLEWGSDLSPLSWKSLSEEWATNVHLFYRVVEADRPFESLAIRAYGEDSAKVLIRTYDNSKGLELGQFTTPGRIVIDTDQWADGNHHVYLRAFGYASQWCFQELTNGVPTPNEISTTLYRKRYVVMQYAFNTSKIPNVQAGTPGVVTGRYAVSHWGDLPYFGEDWQVWQKSINSLWGPYPYLKWHRYTTNNGFIVSTQAYDSIAILPTNGYSNVDVFAAPGTRLICRLSGNYEKAEGYGKILIESIVETPPPGVPLREE